MKRVTHQQYARASAAVQQDLWNTEGDAVRRFRARRAFLRQAPEKTKQERHRERSADFRAHGATS